MIFDVTDDHPWRAANGRWVQTAALRPEVRLIRSQGPPATVVSVVHTDRVEQTYNLDVDDFHTFFVGEDRVWVHNACDPPKRINIPYKAPNPLEGTKGTVGVPERPIAEAPKSVWNHVADWFGAIFGDM